MNLVQQIAAMLTEDPDVFLELYTAPTGEAGTPSMTGDLATANAAMLKKQAGEDKLKNTQQDLEVKQAEQQKKILQPQVDKVQRQLRGTQKDSRAQGQDMANSMDKQNLDLDKELRNIQQLLDRLDKAI